jgi:hypothetical protein
METIVSAYLACTALPPSIPGALQHFLNQLIFLNVVISLFQINQFVSMLSSKFLSHILLYPITLGHLMDMDMDMDTVSSYSQI